jgi:hypothetical protein
VCVGSSLGGWAAAGRASAGTAAKVAAPTTTLFRKSLRPAGFFGVFAITIASALIAGNVARRGAKSLASKKAGRKDKLVPKLKLFASARLPQPGRSRE